MRIEEEERADAVEDGFVGIIVRPGVARFEMHLVHVSHRAQVMAVHDTAGLKRFVRTAPHRGRDADTSGTELPLGLLPTD